VLLSALIFKVELTDVLSGYRAFTREFAKNIPVFGGGFETEVELTIKALARPVEARPTVRPRNRRGSAGVAMNFAAFSLFWMRPA
jgi:hypothetical protein